MNAKFRNNPERYEPVTYEYLLTYPVENSDSLDGLGFYYEITGLTYSIEAAFNRNTDEFFFDVWTSVNDSDWDNIDTDIDLCTEELIGAMLSIAPIEYWYRDREFTDLPF